MGYRKIETGSVFRNSIQHVDWTRKRETRKTIPIVQVQDDETSGQQEWEELHKDEVFKEGHGVYWLGMRKVYL